MRERPPGGVLASLGHYGMRLRNSDPLNGHLHRTFGRKVMTGSGRIVCPLTTRKRAVDAIVAKINSLSKSGRRVEA